MRSRADWSVDQNVPQSCCLIGCSNSTRLDHVLFTSSWPLVRLELPPSSSPSSLPSWPSWPSSPSWQPWLQEKNWGTRNAVITDCEWNTCNVYSEHIDRGTRATWQNMFFTSSGSCGNQMRSQSDWSVNRKRASELKLDKRENIMRHEIWNMKPFQPSFETQCNQ